MPWVLGADVGVMGVGRLGGSSQRAWPRLPCVGLPWGCRATQWWGVSSAHSTLTTALSPGRPRQLAPRPQNLPSGRPFPRSRFLGRGRETPGLRLSSRESSLRVPTRLVGLLGARWAALIWPPPAWARPLAARCPHVQGSKSTAAAGRSPVRVEHGINSWSTQCLRGDAEGLRRAS